MKAATIPTGPQLAHELQATGVAVQQVTLRRSTGHYVAEFYHPKMRTPVKPSRLWAEIMKERLNYQGRRCLIIDHHDTIATWRDDQPVIWASVTFALCPD